MRGDPTLYTNFISYLDVRADPIMCVMYLFLSFFFQFYLIFSFISSFWEKRLTCSIFGFIFVTFYFFFFLSFSFSHNIIYFFVVLLEYIFKSLENTSQEREKKERKREKNIN